MYIKTFRNAVLPDRISNQLWTLKSLMRWKVRCRIRPKDTQHSYWTRLNKISRFVSCKQIKYLPQAEVNKWSERHWQIAILFNNCFSQFSYLNYSLTAQGSDLPFFMRGFHYAWAEYYLLQNTFSRPFFCRKLFAGHVVGSRPMKMKRKMHRMIIAYILILRWRLVIKQK